MKNNLLEIIDKITLQFTESSSKEKYSIAEELEQYLETYLQKNPDDSEIWLKLALIVYKLPLADDFKAINCLNKALAIDSNNCYTALLLGYIKEYLCYIDDQLFTILCN